VGVNIEINNTTNSPIENGFFEAVAEKTFAQLQFDFLKNKKISISVALVPKEEIKKLNNQYRKYNNVTDILSFPEFMGQKEIEKAAGDEIFLGELILCYNDVEEYSKGEGIKLERELAKVVSHGILHLLGFSHGEKMFAIQEAVTRQMVK
jgi:probable rRNA maturation factor